MNLQSAPSNWHVAVNLPITLVWIVGIPFAACTFLQIPLWWAILIAPIWALLTGRITDRWLPALTGPAIDRVFIAMGGERKHPGLYLPFDLWFASNATSDPADHRDLSPPDDPACGESVPGWSPINELVN